MPGEREEFDRHLAGEEPPSDLHYAWLDTVATATAAGKVFQRVHVVRSPLSECLKHEFAWGYAFNVKAGEDIRILDLAERPDPGLPNTDYWLLDDTIVIRLDYRPDGTQVGRELLEGAEPGPYIEWKQLALAHAVPLMEYDQS